MGSMEAGEGKRNPRPSSPTRARAPALAHQPKLHSPSRDVSRYRPRLPARSLPPALPLPLPAAGMSSVVISTAVSPLARFLASAVALSTQTQTQTLHRTCPEASGGNSAAAATGPSSPVPRFVAGTGRQGSLPSGRPSRKFLRAFEKARENGEVGASSRHGWRITSARAESVRCLLGLDVPSVCVRAAFPFFFDVICW
ncbi:uncharacterized protein K452DRAFT_872 [Aplosporella prunicola CBS 121167]|uniref:Uncharacterized protein n=1 Tax=Aplosporella prunicola CBS 121167 TaxID=1176127 RepID=A0A6A6BV09_9PEZI|nr:uncharacterized protein K452DRAFT_872 [Aplosporella prunicola CBS 121167]KAF2147054.1 hypothetical protein K452DRAFT_872 [Aplosporella prunicola CBS 121167]